MKLILIWKLAIVLQLFWDCHHVASAASTDKIPRACSLTGNDERVIMRNSRVHPPIKACLFDLGLFDWLAAEYFFDPILPKVTRDFLCPQL